MKTQLDHLVITAPSRAAGGSWVFMETSAVMPKGGDHPAMGTHNLLTSFGPDTFLEVISVDPDTAAPGRARWYGLDSPPAVPTLSAWVLGTDDIESALAAARDCGCDLGTALPVTRGALSWRFAVPDSGHTPLGGIAPHIMQWDTPDPHPASGMADLGLRLLDLVIETPKAAALGRLLDALCLEDRPEIRKSEVTRLTAKLTCPDGRDAVLRQGEIYG